MFTSRCNLYFAQGNKKPMHKPCIRNVDKEKIGRYFQTWYKDPVILNEANWFNLCFYFGRRGHEGWASMSKDHFVITQDDERHEYVYMQTTEVTINHQGGHTQDEHDYFSQRMYGPGVTMYRYLLEKLNPDCTGYSSTHLKFIPRIEYGTKSPQWVKRLSLK